MNRYRNGVERLEPRRLLSASLVKDINLGPGLNPGLYAIVSAGNTVFLGQEDTVAGWELWKTDGTSGNTTLVKDIRPGRDNSQVGWLTYAGGSTVFFTADDGVHGFELWKSDGTEAGTVLVKDIIPGATASTPSNLTNVNGTIYFVATTAANGAELWKSDGSEAGTVMVKDIQAGTTGSSPSQLINNNGTLFFRATTTASGAELWKSDGSDLGTVQIKEIYNNNNNGVQATNFAVRNGIVYFAGISASSGMEIWKSDGTDLGTTMIKEITGGSSGSSITNIKTSGSYVYFNVGSTPALWRTDGSDPGTISIMAGLPVATCDVNGTLFFGNGTTLYTTTGTGATSVRTGLTMNTQNWVSGNGLLFFPGDVSSGTTTGEELWRSDGTTGGTTITTDIYPGTTKSSVYAVTAWGVGGSNGIMFGAITPSTGMVLHKSDGTPGGTQLVKDIYTGTSDSGPLLLTPYNGKLYFLAFEPGFGETGGELYVSDGTEAGTHIVIDLNPGAVGGSVSNLKVFGGYLYFVGTNGSSGKELWRTDGTAGGTTLVADINVGTGDSSPFELTVAGSYLYFGASTPANGEELWRTDGTAGGTIRLSDVNPGTGGSSIEIYGESGGTLYFTANNSVGFAGWFKSNGTTGTTGLVSSSFTAVGSSLNINGTLYVALTTSAGGSELYRMDPGGVGPTLVKDIVAGSGSSSPQQFANVDGVLFFSATTSANGGELWKSDGTAAGTVMIKDIFAGSSNSTPQSFAAANGVAYFRADNGTLGAELWRSDGTTAGTFLLKDIQPGSVSSNANRFVALAGFVYFSADDGVNGLEAWRTDGTPEGTAMLGDYYPEGEFILLPANGAFFTAVGTDMYYRFSDDNHGTELWKADQPDFAVLGGGGALAVRATANNDVIDISSTGSGVTITLNGLTETFAPGAVSSIQLTCLGGNDTINLNAGTVTFSSDAGAGTPNLKLLIASGASAVFSSTQHIADLQLNGGNASLTPGGFKVLAVSSLTIGIGTQLDLGDGSLALDYTGASPLGIYNGFSYTGVTKFVQSGRNDGAWNGQGIMTSRPAAVSQLTTLGISEAADAFGLGASDTMIYNGVTLDATTVLIKYTYGGDANLDGVINPDDYALIDFYSHVAGSFGYFKGDFNLDGEINADDYALIDFNNNAQGPPL